MSASAHYDAMFARLNADSMLAGKGSDSAKRTAGGDPVRANYWVLYRADVADLDDGRYSTIQRPNTTGRYRFDFRAVGTTTAAVMAFMDRAKQQLIGVKIPVGGRVTDPAFLVPEVDGGDVRYDKETDLFYADRSFEFVSQPVREEP